MFRQCELNILRAYHSATADEMDAGLRWYKFAHDEACRLHKDCKIGSAILAAVSPGLRWESNVQAAERIIKKRSLTGLGVRWFDGVKKARKILRGGDPNVILGGNKVRAFYHCILNPNNDVHVCIDGHAYAIWAGKRITLDKTPNMTNRLYHKISSSYVSVSRDLGIRPNQLQAITWCAWRRLHGVVKATEEVAPF
jgi:hypothetical protein